MDFSELPDMLVVREPALLELHKSSHKTGKMPVAALRDQLDFSFKCALHTQP